jgi:hypothetical protein
VNHAGETIAALDTSLAPLRQPAYSTQRLQVCLTPKQENTLRIYAPFTLECGVASFEHVAKAEASSTSETAD